MRYLLILLVLVSISITSTAAPIPKERQQPRFRVGVVTFWSNGYKFTILSEHLSEDGRYWYWVKDGGWEPSLWVEDSITRALEVCRQGPGNSPRHPPAESWLGRLWCIY